jgi:carboxymethylenebutenolidase
MPATRTISIPTADGPMSGHLAVPDSGSGPGLLVLQEIFGVNVYIRDVCDRLANAGYVALAPDLFWRLQPGVALENFDDADLQTGIGFAMRFDAEAGIADLGAALAALRGLPECDGRAGVIGFCFGGTFAYLAAVNLDPDVAVSFYGSGVADAIGEAGRVTCPLQFHFGDSDPFIPNEQVEIIRAAVASLPNVELHVYEGGGHAFDNHFSPTFSQPVPAAEAWKRTLAFLAQSFG